MFKDSQVEIHDLQTKMAELERVNERLKAATATTGVAVAQTGSAAKTSSAFAGAQALPPGLKDVTAAKKGSKRKQDEVKVSASARPTKKVATKNDQQPTPLLVNDNLIDDFGLFDVPGAGTILTRIIVVND
jgi:hypothetical protein